MTKPGHGTIAAVRTAGQPYRVGIRLLAWTEGFSIRIFAGILDFMRDGVDWDLHYDRDSGGDLPLRPITEDWEGDGLIVYRHTAREAEAWRKRKIRVVNLSAEYPAGTLPFPRVTMDNDAVARLAAEHLTSLGLRHLAYWHEPDRIYSQERWAAFRQIGETLGCDVHRLDVPANRYPPRSRAAMIEKVALAGLPRLPRPCGLFAKDDIAGVAALRAARMLGIRCPEQLAILAVNDDPVFCQTVRPALSSIRFPGRAIGHQAAELLDSLLAGRCRDDGKTRVLLPPGMLLRRESTGHVELGDPVVQRAMQELRRLSPRVAVSVTDLAKAAGVSRELLRQRMTKALGRTPKQEVDLARKTAVEGLLESSDLTLEAIAETVGFSGPDDLSRFFKRVTGRSPGAFRQEFRKAR